MRFALSRISGVDDCLMILRTSAMISKTANGLTPAVSAKPLADDRDERFMVVLLHNPPGVIAEMAGVSTFLDPSGLVVVPFGPAAPQIQTVIRTSPLATARGRRPVLQRLLLIEFLEARTPRLAADCGLRIAGGGSRSGERGSRIASVVRFSIFDPRSSILHPRFNFTRRVQQFYGQIFRPVFVLIITFGIARADDDRIVILIGARLDERSAARDRA